jgi:phosphatidylinositol-bisphosphatase
MVSTYNLNGKSPAAFEAHEVDLNEWLFKSEQFHDFYVIGFQEMVDLNAANVVLNLQSGKRAREWNPLVLATLNQRAAKRGAGVEYFEVASQTLVGVHILVLAKTKHRPFITSVHRNNAAVGIAGVLGNKGGSAIRFRFKDSSFCFISSHLVRGAFSVFLVA